MSKRASKHVSELEALQGDQARARAVRPKSSREGAAAWIEMVLADADRIRAAGALAAGDGVKVECHRNELEMAWSEHSKWIDMLTKGNESTRDYIYIQLWKLISSMSLIAAKIYFSESSLAYAEKIHARSMRGFRATKVAGRVQERRRAIRAVAEEKGLTLNISEKCALAIQDDVHARLGGKRKPGVKTLIGDIKAIRQQKSDG